VTLREKAFKAILKAEVTAAGQMEHAAEFGIRYPDKAKEILETSRQIAERDRVAAYWAVRAYFMSEDE